MKSESEIEWSSYMETPAYAFNDAVHCSKTIIKPNEEFKVGFVDPRHTAANWTLKNSDGQTVASSTGTTEFTVNNLSAVGNYDLEVTGDVHSESGTTTQTRTFKAFRSNNR